MKTSVTEPDYIESSIIRKIFIYSESLIMGIFQLKNEETKNSDPGEADLSGEKERALSIDDYAGAIDQLAKYRAGIF